MHGLPSPCEACLALPTEAYSCGPPLKMAKAIKIKRQKKTGAAGSKKTGAAVSKKKVMKAMTAMKVLKLAPMKAAPMKAMIETFITIKF